MSQHADVLWNGSHSSKFHLKNGVRQGSVISCLFYCLYVDDLFQLLRNRKTGCWINSFFYGIIGYSDDSFLMAPTQSALQEMILTCEEYANSHGLIFSTNPIVHKSKTKCMAFLRRNSNVTLRQMKLNGHTLPWVDQCKHLGNIYCSSKKNATTIN